MNLFKSIISICLMVCIMFIARTAMAENRAGAVSVSPMVGWYVFDDRQDIDSGPLGGLGLGYNFTRNWGAELMMDYIHADEEGHGNDTVHGYLGHLDALYHFMPEGKLVPYVAAGFGAIHLDQNPNGAETQGLFNYGAGLKYFITNSIALRGDVRHIISFDESDNNLAASLGMTFLFGGHKQEKVAAAPKVIEVIELNVEFDFDKSDVKPVYHERIKEAADYLDRHPDVDAILQGNTDSRGSESYNKSLSQRRADSVRRYLIDKFGISPSRLTTKAQGESDPVSNNSTDAGMQRNRHILVIFVK